MNEPAIRCLPYSGVFKLGALIEALFRPEKGLVRASTKDGKKERVSCRRLIFLNANLPPHSLGKGE